MILQTSDSTGTRLSLRFRPTLEELSRSRLEHDAQVRLIAPCDLWWPAAAMLPCGVGVNEFASSARL